MNTVNSNVGLVKLYNELQAGADVSRLAFNSRDVPTSNARTGADLFANAGMQPLSIHTGAGLHELVALFRPELDSGGLRLENFDVALTVEPYHLRERFGTLLQAFKARIQAELRGINLRLEMTPESVASIRRLVAKNRIDGETFQVAAGSAYLDLLRLRKYAEADKLAAAFPAGADANTAVFGVARLAPKVIFEAYEDGKHSAIELLGESSGRAAGLSDLEALLARGRISKSEISDAVEKHLYREAREGKIDPTFEPYLNDRLRAGYRRHREEHARREACALARGFVSGMFGSNKTDEHAEKSITAECDALNAFKDEGLISEGDVRDAIRTGFLQTLAEHGLLATQTRMWAKRPEVQDITDERIGALEHYARKLLEREPCAEWVSELMTHAEFFDGGVQPVILGAVYRAKHSVHVDQTTLDAIAEHFPELAATVSAVRPPVFVKGIDLRARLRAELTSPEAKALATVFCDWHGPGLGRWASDHDPLSPTRRISEMREACVAIMPLPEVEPHEAAGLMNAIDKIMIADGSMTKQDVTDREKRDRDHKEKLGLRIRAALGDKLTAVPYLGLLELQNALVRLNEEIKALNGTTASHETYSEERAEYDLFTELMAKHRDGKAADLRPTFDGVRYVIDGVGKTAHVNLPPGVRLEFAGDPYTLRLEDKVHGRFHTDWTTSSARADKGTRAVFITVEVEDGRPSFVAHQVKPPMTSMHHTSADTLQELVDRVFEQMVLPGDLARRCTEVKLDNGKSVLANGPSRTGEIELTGDNIAYRFFYDPATKQVRFPEGASSNWVKPEIVAGSVERGELLVRSFANAYATEPGDQRETIKVTLLPGNIPDQACAARVRAPQ